MRNFILTWLCLAGLSCTSASFAQQLEWIRQFGTSEQDVGSNASFSATGTVWSSVNNRNDAAGPSTENFGLPAFSRGY